ncbi:hypothetical protein OS493_003527 [Desmophyllum pertusum]|uniref:Uncharacterized protein n=1 Tax=Desmophyllum pertusum TaxID=174260 RepID=A0A9X0A6C6_9CNID|nr:hypothetical protein OS493_003527 [Desmophyllum pertusum]
MNGDQGNTWKKAEVTITGDYDLEFKGVAGNSYQADIAIDDISVSDGSCGGVPPTTTAPPQPTSIVYLVMLDTPFLWHIIISRVIGGVDATPGNWPWQIALLRGGSKSFSCGGSLIAPDWIVTAAHCIARGQPGSYYTIRLGDHNRHVTEGTEQDIPGKQTGHVECPSKTVCLPSHDEVVPTSSRCFITGWGKIKHPGSSHHILQQANLPSVTNSECAKKLATSPGGSSLQITPKMICAGVNGTILSGCHGDSGGPYVCQNSAGNWVLQGAVSWGSPRCSAAERYTVFARVGKFRNWIDQMMGASPTPSQGPNPSSAPTTAAPTTAVPTTAAPTTAALSTAAPTPQSDPSCDFENDLCSWKQETTDNFDWTRKSGATSSSGTGPSSGHSGNGYYVYIETSSPRVSNDTAILTFKGINKKVVCLSFYYHMYGFDVNTLNLNNNGKKFWSMNGDQGNTWKKAEVTITGDYGLEFKGVAGNSFQADIAIDDISVSDGSCGGVPPTTSAPPQPTTPTTAAPTTAAPTPQSVRLLVISHRDDATCILIMMPFIAPTTAAPVTVAPTTTAPAPQSDPSCDFERDLCSWKQGTSDNFDWTRISRATPSSSTGPSSGHGGKGSYLYIEASHPRTEDDVAILSFSGTNSKPVVCLTFYYHMYGNDINELYLYNRGKNVWRMSGDQGDEWKKAQIIITGNFQLVLIASVGKSYLGDIAIDDISVTDGYCVVVPPSPSLQPTPPIHSQGPPIPPVCGGPYLSNSTADIPATFMNTYVEFITQYCPNRVAIHQCQESLAELMQPQEIGHGRLGKDKAPGFFSSHTATSNLPSVTNSECAKKLATSPGGSSLQITQNMICGGVNGTILSGCHGDSGGPYVCQNSAGNWVLQGAVSWGSPRCSAAERYSVFARVAKFRNWIDQTMRT